MALSLDDLAAGALAPPEEPAAVVEQPAPAEAPAPAPEAPVEEGPGVLGTLADMAGAVPGGVANALEATGDFVSDVAEGVNLPAGIALGSDAENGIAQFLSQEELDAKGGDEFFGKQDVRDNAIPQATTTAGQITSGVTQFVTSFVGVGKLMPFLKAAKGAKAGTQIASAAARGAIADFIGIGGKEDRLSDFLADNLGLRTVVTDYLQNDPDDSAVEGRFKNSLEGLGLGLAAEGVFKAFRVIGKARALAREKGLDKAAEYVAENVDELDEVAKQLDLFDDAATDALDIPTPRAGSAAEVTINNRAAQGVTREVEAALHNKPVDVDLLREGTKRTGAYLDMETVGGREIINHSKLDSATSIQEAMKAMAVVAQENIDATVKAGTKTFAEIEKEALDFLADTTNLGADVLRANVGRMAGDADQLAGTMVATKGMIQSLSREFMVLAQKEAQVGLNAFEQVRMGLLAQQWEDLTVSLKSVQKGVARAQAAGRIRTSDILSKDGVNTAILTDMAARASNPRIKAMAQALRGTDGDPGAINEIMRKRGSILDMSVEYYINALLSGPKTHIVNGASNIVQTVFLPLEKVVGGALSGNMDAVTEGVRHAYYTTTMLKESGQMAMRSLKMADNILDVNTVMDPAITRHAITSGEDTVMGATLRTVGSVVRAPTRLLQASDEMFKQINYRAALKSRLMVEASKRFPVSNTLDDAARKVELTKRLRWVENEFAKGFHPETGRALDEEALAFAREATFTQTLDARNGIIDRLGLFAQNGVEVAPAFRFILPFVRTPTNLLRFTFERTPILQAASKEFRADIAAGGIRRSRAVGKITTGMALYGSAVSLAAEGRITGGGPADPNEKARLLATGWRPYSFVTTGDDGKKVYTSFARMDPLASFFGLAADFHVISANLTTDQAEEMGAAAGIAVARNITSKSYLRGLAEALDAANQPDTKMLRFFSGLVGGFMPTGAKQISESLGITDDPYMRDARALFDGFVSRIPGLSQTVPPKVDWVTGEPVRYPDGYMFGNILTPFPRTKRTSNAVIEEMARLRHSFRPPARKVEGVELTGEQYAEYLKKIGTITESGKTLADTLLEVMQDYEYDVKRESYPDNHDDPATNRRVMMLRPVIEGYRRLAWEKMKESDKTLSAAVAQKRAENVAILTGEATDDTPDLQKRLQDLLQRSQNPPPR